MIPSMLVLFRPWAPSTRPTLKDLRGIPGPGLERRCPALAVVEGHEPVRQLGMSSVLTPEASFDLGVGVQERLLPLLEVADLAKARLGGDQIAEEELEEQLAAEGFRPGREGQPGPELVQPARRDGVQVTIGFAALALVTADDQTIGGQPAQDRIDLAEALAPEVRDAAVDRLLDVVAGAGPAPEHPEHGVAGRIAGCHIADRYMRARIESRGAPRLVFR